MFGLCIVSIVDSHFFLVQLLNHNAWYMNPTIRLSLVKRILSMPLLFTEQRKDEDYDEVVEETLLDEVKTIWDLLKTYRIISNRSPCPIEGLPLFFIMHIMSRLFLQTSFGVKQLRRHLVFSWECIHRWCYHLLPLSSGFKTDEVDGNATYEYSPN